MGGWLSSLPSGRFPDKRQRARKPTARRHVQYQPVSVRIEGFPPGGRTMARGSLVVRAHRLVDATAAQSLAGSAHRIEDATPARAIPLRLFEGHVHRLAQLAIAVLVAEGALALIFYLAPSLFVGRGVFGLAGIFAFSGLVLTRLAFLRVVDGDMFKRRVLVWGAGARAATIAKRLRRSTDQRGFKIVGHVRAPGDGVGVPDHQVLQFDGDLLHLAMRHGVEEIVVAMDDRRSGFPTQELLECRLRGIAVYDVLAFLERETGRVSVELMQSSWFIFSNGFRCNIPRLASKRLFDVVV